MTAEGPVQGWDDAVATFLRRNLPPLDGEAKGWDHMFSTAYQIGCMALVALGEASEEVWGALPRTPPVRPKVLPRWDDVAISVLWLAEQQNLLEWRMPDGGIPPRRASQFTIRRPDVPPPRPPNIAAIDGCGPARATAEVVAVLETLGLVAGGTWTVASETVLWRCKPAAWSIDFTQDPRFGAAVETCLLSMPPEIRSELSDLSMVTAKDVATAHAQRAAEAEKWLTRLPHMQVMPVPTDEEMRRDVAFVRGNAADWLFFRSWRLPDSWLTAAEAERTLEVFHDPVAIAMRRAIVAHLFPGSDLDRGKFR